MYHWVTITALLTKWKMNNKYWLLKLIKCMHFFDCCFFFLLLFTVILHQQSPVNINNMINHMYMRLNCSIKLKNSIKLKINSTFPQGCLGKRIPQGLRCPFSSSGSLVSFGNRVDGSFVNIRVIIFMKTMCIFHLVLARMQSDPSSKEQSGKSNKPKKQIWSKKEVEVKNSGNDSQTNKDGDKHAKIQKTNWS